MYHKGVVIINDVPTVIETWGRWIEESPNPSQQSEDIILCIPGNPGVTGYYTNFLQTIYDKLQCPVWVIGHAGHQRITNEHINVPKLEGNEKLYDVQGQIDHKEAFIKKYVPANARLFIIAHSIGSYVSLNLLKNPDIKSKVAKAYLMFPTIEDMAVTPNGKFLNYTVYYILWLIYFLSWFFTILPEKVKYFLIYVYFALNWNTNTDIIAATVDLIHPAELNKIFYMGYDEMEVVKDLDAELLKPHMNQVKLYYGATDNWAPASYYRRLKEKYPDVNAEICVRKFAHAFVLHTPEDVGNMVAGWIEIDK